MKDNMFCKLFGCDVRDGFCCNRCGLMIYDVFPGVFWYELGELRRLEYSFLSFIKERLPFRRCAECHKFIWSKTGYFCSEKCKDNWVPF